MAKTKQRKFTKAETARAVNALHLINRLCVCVKNKRRPVLSMDRTGKLSSFTFEQAAGAVFEAMTGLPAHEFIVFPDKKQRNGGA